MHPINTSLQGAKKIVDAKSEYLGAFVLLNLFLLAPSCAAPPVEFRGIVRDGDDQAVAQEEVSIDGGGAFQTSDRGEFAFPSSQGIDIDSEVRFHVKHWIIVKPCESRNGRMFLPPPQRVVELEVYLPTDNRLLTV